MWIYSGLRGGFYCVPGSIQVSPFYFQTKHIGVINFLNSSCEQFLPETRADRYSSLNSNKIMGRLTEFRGKDT